MQLCCFLWQPGSCKVLWQGSSVPILHREAILKTSDSHVLDSCIDLEFKINTLEKKNALLHFRILPYKTFPYVKYVRIIFFSKKKKSARYKLSGITCPLALNGQNLFLGEAPVFCQTFPASGLQEFVRQAPGN